MATLDEMRAWREELFYNMSTGVLRATFMDRTTEFRSLADMQRALKLLDDQIAAEAGTGKVPVRVVYSPGQKYL